MQQALDLARATVGLASPNPMVGCVLVREHRIIGAGAHRYEAFDHAEIVALKDAVSRGQVVAGATAYVTLEPCSHHGRTGPCADALIAARIARVVVATADPNPQVSGRGLQRLQAAGIDVQVGILQPEARALNDAFAQWIRTGRPLVTLKSALSAEGMLAPPAAVRKPGETFWLTGPESRAEVQRMRHAADAVLTGIGTVLADDPLLTDRSDLPRRRRLLRVVMDSAARTPLHSKLVRSAEDDVLIVTSAAASVDRIAALREAKVHVAEVEVEMEANSGRLDPASVLLELSRRQVLDLLLECGSRLNGAFLEADLVDRAVLIHSPATLGPGAVPFAEGVSSPADVERKLHSVQHQPFGIDRAVSGYLHDPWADS